MPPTSTLPFQLKRTSQVMGAEEFRTTTERIDGLLRLDGDALMVQWRVARQTQRYGSEIRTDEELDPVREVRIPLGALAGAELQVRSWLRLGGARLVLTASDLRAFEDVAGAAGLSLEHPSKLELAIRRGDRLPAREFAADVNLALAERALQKADSTDTLPPGR